MVEEAQKRSTGLNSPIAYVYCDHAELSTLTASSILASLVKQLLLYLDILGLPWPSQLGERLKREFRRCRKCLLSHEFTDILVELLPRFDNTILFVDGLDECDPKESEQLLCSLERLLRSRCTELKVFVASRDEMDVSKYLPGCFRISTSEDNIVSDIQLYIDMAVARKIVNTGLTRSPQIIQDIKSSLLKGSQGM